MARIPEIHELFITIMDLIDQKKTVAEKVLLQELKIEYAHIDPTTLFPNLFFCLEKLIEAELIEKIGTSYRLKAKGKKVLQAEDAHVGLKEIDFYISHGDEFFGQPITSFKPKVHLKKWAQKQSLLIASFFMVIVGAFLISTILNRQADKVGGVAVDAAFDTLTNDLTGKKLDKTFDGVVDELTK